jgi:hypothetical protein
MAEGAMKRGLGGLEGSHQGFCSTNPSAPSVAAYGRGSNPGSAASSLQHIDRRKLQGSLPRKITRRIRAKLGIVLEEADETVFWLELIQEGNIFPAEKLRELVREANELVSIFVVSARTVKTLPLQSHL